MPKGKSRIHTRTHNYAYSDQLEDVVGLSRAKIKYEYYNFIKRLQRFTTSNYFKFLPEQEGYFGPSGVRALPLVAGRNEGGNYFRYFSTCFLLLLGGTVIQNPRRAPK